VYGLPDLFGENYSATELIEAAMGGFNERIDVSSTYPTDTPDVFVRGGIGLFSTAGDYTRFAQMLANNGRVDGESLLSRKTLELMHCNHLSADMMPFELLGEPWPGMGFGLGSRVVLDVAQTGGTGSVGEYGWAGVAKTYYWVDPVEELVGVLMTQYMSGVLLPERELRSLTDQAIID
jgi:CubicO group peptidase (beta-lactamase class C family)